MRRSERVHPVTAVRFVTGQYDGPIGAYLGAAGRSIGLVFMSLKDFDAFDTDTDNLFTDTTLPSSQGGTWIYFTSHEFRYVHNATVAQDSASYFPKKGEMFIQQVSLGSHAAFNYVHDRVFAVASLAGTSVNTNHGITIGNRTGTGNATQLCKNFAIVSVFDAEAFQTMGEAKVRQQLIRQNIEQGREPWAGLPDVRNAYLAEDLREDIKSWEPRVGSWTLTRGLPSGESGYEPNTEVFTTSSYTMARPNETPLPRRENLVADWRFDRDLTFVGATSDISGVKDQSGNGWDLEEETTTYAGDFPNYQCVPSTGFPGEGAEFNRTRQDCLKTSGFADLTTEMTIGMWVRIVVASSQSTMLSKGDSSVAHDWFVQWLDIGGSMRLIFSAHTDAQAYSNYIYSSDTIATDYVDKWTHFACRFDGSQATDLAKLNVFVNGVKKTMASTAGGDFIPSTLRNAGSVYVGNWVGFTSRGFNGIIRDTTIYDAALSDAEVKQLYAARLVG